MDQESFERSESAFYQYEARKVLDRAEQSGYTYVRADNLKFIGKNTEPFVDLKECLKISDPKLVMAFGDLLKERNQSSDEYWAEHIGKRLNEL